MNKAKLLIILILVSNLLLRLPALFDPVSYGDECIYLTLGRAFNQGLVFYRDIHDNKPPLLYLVAALAGGKLFWFRLVMIFWNSLNLYLIYYLSKMIFKKESISLLTAFLFALFTLLSEGRIANGEIFMIFPATVGVYIAILAEKKQKNLLWFFSGIAFSLAFLFKVPVFFDFLGLLTAFFIFTQTKISLTKKTFKLTLKNVFNKKLFFSLGGFSLPILLTIIYYGLNGAFIPYVRSALLQNIGYLSSWHASSYGLIYRTLILLVFVILLFKLRKRVDFNFSLFSLLTIFSLYGVFLSERPYPHYLLEAAPWFSLLVGATLIKINKTKILVTLFLALLLIAGVKKYKFWWYPNLPYYQNFINFSLGKINQETYFSYFGSVTLNNYQIAKYLKTHTFPQDRVFIWGDGACIYTLSQRLPVGRYTVNYHIYDFSGFEETFKAIKEKQPNTIVLLEPVPNNFSQLSILLINNYLQTEQIGETQIYHKIIPL